MGITNLKLCIDFDKCGICTEFSHCDYHLIQFDMSQVTDPLDLSNCHTCPRSQVLLTKPLADWPNFRVQNYYKNDQTTSLFLFFTQDC